MHATLPRGEQGGSKRNPRGITRPAQAQAFLGAEGWGVDCGREGAALRRDRDVPGHDMT